MKARSWMAVVLGGMVVMATLAPAGQAQEKKTTKPATGTKSEQAMPGCAMHGAGMAAGEKGADPGKPGCGMMGGGAAAMGKAGCCKGGPGMAGCGMRCGGGMGMCAGGMGRGPMAGGMCGPGMRGGMGADLCGPGLGCGSGLGLERLRGLDLSPAQKAKLAEIGDRWARLAIQKQADVRLAELDLAKLARDEKPDKLKLDAAIDKLARLRADLAKSCLAARLEARALLTPQQLEQWRGGALGPMGEEEGED